MPEVILFRPRREVDAEENLKAFIELCRTEITALGANTQFNALAWNFREYFPHASSKFLRFSAYEMTGKLATSKKLVMAEPYCSFAKAYLAYNYNLAPSGHEVVERNMRALRVLELAWRTSSKTRRFATINAATFNRAVQFMQEGGLADETIYGTAQHLEQVAVFLNENFLVGVPIQWVAPVKIPARSYERPGKEGDIARSKKLPSKAAIDAIPQIFHLCSSHPEDEVAQVTTAFCAILMATPDRARELLSQRIDLEVSNFSEANSGYGLRWYPKKGGKPLIKPVPTPMVEVTQEAIRRIKEISKQARLLSDWYEKHPSELYFHPDVVHLKGKDILSAREIGDLLWGKSCSDATPRAWANAMGLKALPKKRIAEKSYYRFEDVEKAVISMLPPGFPYFDGKTRYSDLLFLTVGDTLRPYRTRMRVIFGPISFHQVLGALRGTSKIPTIFDAYGFTEADGSRIEVKTHQFRHWLNTIGQIQGLSQLDIALWSGRRNIAQNAVYNHVTPEQRLEMLRGALEHGGRASSHLGGLPKVIPISRDEYLAQKIPTAHVTDFGYCIHDFSMAPCQLHRDCLFCNDHVCVKGDLAAEERLEAKLAETRRLLDAAKAALGDEFGADRWVEHNAELVKRMASLIEVLNDPSVPPGALIQMKSPDAPTRLKLALEQRAQITVSYPYGTPNDVEKNKGIVEQLQSAQSRRPTH